jgi:transaldolase
VDTHRRPGKDQVVTPAPLTDLSAAGVAVWLDDLDRQRIRSAGLARLIEERAVVGVTTNPSIFAAALTGAHAGAYDLEAQKGRPVAEVLREVTTDDVREACDVLAPVVATTSGLDGRVSLEVSAELAHDTAGTIAEGRQLWKTVDRPNLFIKVPATLAGLPAITALVGEGISVNVTLIFSLQRYAAVIDAWMTGLEHLIEQRGPVAGVASVASFFVSRVDTAIDPLLDAIGTPQAAALRGKAALANARLAYELFEQRTAEPRWQALAAHGALVQRPLWASTGVKDPSYPDTLYVDQLVAPHTVNTMPEKTLEAVADHAQIVADTIHGTYEQARSDLAGLAGLGISMDAVTEQLEVEGVAKFADAWTGLVQAVQKRLDA